MADDMAELALEGISAGIDNYEKVYDPLKARAHQIHLRHIESRHPERLDRHQDDGRDRDRDRDRGRLDKDRKDPRRDSGRGGEGRYEESYERRIVRAKSAGRDGYGGRGPNRNGERRRDGRDRYSDSESSLSPPPNRRKSVGGKTLVALGAGGVGAAASHEFHEYRRDRYRSPSPPRRQYPDSIRGDDRPRRAETFDDNYAQAPRLPAGYLGANVSERDLRVAKRNDNPSESAVSTRRNATSTELGSRSRRSSSTTTTDTSSVCSSSEDERRIKKMKGKEYLTAGLAAVATIHAAKGVFSSMEARDKRHEELWKGEITPEEARKKRNKARLQDVASIGIAALGIKGAYSEWKEVQENRQEVAAQKEERKKRHEKRMKKAEHAARRAKERARQEMGGYRSA